MVIDNVLRVIFVRSEENDGNLWTKNVTKELYEKHSAKVVWKAEDLGMMGIDNSDGRISYLKIGKGVYRNGRPDGNLG